MNFSIIKTYVTVKPETGNRLELKFINKVPILQEIQNAVDKATQPIPEPNQCPMNNPQCPLYRKGK